jgi:hypothetical protein
MLKKNLYAFSALLALSCSAYAMDPSQEDETEKDQIQKAHQMILKQLNDSKNGINNEAEKPLTDDDRDLLERLKKKFSS